MDKRNRFGPLDLVTYCLKRETPKDLCFTLPQVTYCMRSLKTWIGEENSLIAQIDTKVKGTRTLKVSENYSIEQKITIAKDIELKNYNSNHWANKKLERTTN